MTGQRKTTRQTAQENSLDLYDGEVLVDHGVLSVFDDGTLSSEEKFLIAEKRGRGFLGVPKRELRVASEIRAPGFAEVMTTSFAFSRKVEPKTASAAIESKRGDVLLSRSTVDLKLKTPQSVLRLQSLEQKKPVQIKTGFGKNSIACVQPSVVAYGLKLLDKSFRKKKAEHEFEVVEVDSGDGTLPSFRRTLLKGGFYKSVNAETDLGDTIRLEHFVFDGQNVKAGKVDKESRTRWHFWTDNNLRLQKLLIQQESGEKEVIRTINQTPAYMRLRP